MSRRLAPACQLLIIDINRRILSLTLLEVPSRPRQSRPMLPIKMAPTSSMKFLTSSTNSTRKTSVKIIDLWNLPPLLRSPTGCQLVIWTKIVYLSNPILGRLRELRVEFTLGSLIPAVQAGRSLSTSPYHLSVT